MSRKLSIINKIAIVGILILGVLVLYTKNRVFMLMISYIVAIVLMNNSLNLYKEKNNNLAILNFITSVIIIIISSYFHIPNI